MYLTRWKTATKLFQKEDPRLCKKTLSHDMHIAYVRSSKMVSPLTNYLCIDYRTSNCTKDIKQADASLQSSLPAYSTPSYIRENLQINLEPKMVTALPKNAAPLNLKIEVTPTSALLDSSRKKTLRKLCSLINDTFAAHGHPRDNGETTPGALFSCKRLTHDEELAEKMGPEALTAICTDENLQDGDADNGHTINHHQQEQTGRYGKIVATASLKLWKGKTVDIARSVEDAMNAQRDTSAKLAELTNKDLAQAKQTLAKTSADELLDSWNWEVKLCSSSDDPRYRGRGLMVKCVDALVAELKAQQAAMRRAGDPTGNLPIKLWSTSLEGTGNTEYWMRRGFVRVGEAEVAPAGTWMSTRDITLSTLCKVVE